jgi:cell division protein FtsI/penicillin-binding protein 2
MNDRLQGFRFALCIAVFLTAAAGLGVRLALLHVGPDTGVRARVQQARTFEREIKAPRGNIYDAAGKANILAIDLVLKDVCADPKVIAASTNLLRIVDILSQHLDIPADEVASMLNCPQRRYKRIKAAIHQEEADRLAESLDAAGLKGVFFRDVNLRYYPQRNFLCHLLGFVNYERVGCAGIELRRNSDLKGHPGHLRGKVDAHRHELYRERGEYTPGERGSDVVLTIDQRIQHIVELALDQAMEEHHAKAAWAIVQRVTTGEILAMASRPDFDLNDYRHADDRVKLNRAISVNYEPGSTFKAIAFSAALADGTVTPDTMVDCEQGSWFYKGRPLRDYHAYDILSVADGLKKSSNILTAKLALSLGHERFHWYLKKFGIGSRLGIDLPGEEAGILAPVKKWYGVKATRVAIGQGVAATALQVLNAYCTIANDGYMMKPFVVRQVSDASGEITYAREPEVVRQVIPATTARTMQHLLGRVTEQGGTGRRARVEGYRVAGKTGTAQKPIPGGYSDTAHIASFVGFLPVERPEIGIIVVVDEPQPIHTGGRVAAPFFAAIASQTVRCLDIDPGVDETSTRTVANTRSSASQGASR